MIWHSPHPWNDPNLHPEVEYIWGMKLSWGKILFLVNRYIPFGLLPIILHGERGVRASCACNGLTSGIDRVFLRDEPGCESALLILFLVREYTMTNSFLL